MNSSAEYTCAANKKKKQRACTIARATAAAACGRERAAFAADNITVHNKCVARRQVQCRDRLLPNSNAAATAGVIT